MGIPVEELVERAQAVVCRDPAMVRRDPATGQPPRMKRRTNDGGARMLRKERRAGKP